MTLSQVGWDGNDDGARGADPPTRSDATEDALTAQLRDALESRNTIGQALGILMERQQITAEQAFDVLRRASQRENRKLREIAAELVDHHNARVATQLTRGTRGDPPADPAPTYGGMCETGLPSARQRPEQPAVRTSP